MKLSQPTRLFKEQFSHMCVHVCLCDMVCMCRLVRVGSLLPPHGAQRLNSVISPLEAPVLTEPSHQPSRTFKNQAHNSISILLKEMQIKATPQRFFFFIFETGRTPGVE